MEASEQSAAEWSESLVAEMSEFKELNAYAEERLADALQSSASMGVPNPARTAICCDLLDRVCARFDRYSTFLDDLRRHLYSAVYVDYDSKLANLGRAPRAKDFLQATPYFAEVHRLLGEKRQREREIMLWEADRETGQSAIANKDRVLTAMARKWQRTTLRQMFNAWRIGVKRATRQRQVLSDTLMRWKSSDISSFFRAWALYTERRKRKRRGLELASAEDRLAHLEGQRTALEDETTAARSHLDELRVQMEEASERRREGEAEIKRLQQILDESGETQLREQAALWASLCSTLVREELRWLEFTLRQAEGFDDTLEGIYIDGDDDMSAEKAKPIAGGESDSDNGEDTDSIARMSSRATSTTRGGDPKSPERTKGPAWLAFAGRPFVHVRLLLQETETVEAMRAGREERRRREKASKDAEDDAGAGIVRKPTSRTINKARRKSTMDEASAAGRVQKEFRQRLDRRALQRRQQWAARTSIEEQYVKLRSLPVDILLLRWVNFQLQRCGSNRLVENFSSDFKDSLVLAELLASLNDDTGLMLTPELNAQDYYARAHLVVSRLKAMKCPAMLTAATLVKGASDLIFSTVAFLFTQYPTLHPNEAPFREARVAMDQAKKEWLSVRALWAASPDYADPSKLRRLAKGLQVAGESVRAAASMAAAESSHWNAIRDRVRDFAFTCLMKRARGNPTALPDRKTERERQQYTAIDIKKLGPILGREDGGVRPEEAVKRVTSVLGENMEDIKRIYKHYAATDEEGSVGTMSMDELWTLVKECRLLSKSLTGDRVQQIFWAANASTNGLQDPNNPDSELTINEFVEVLVRLADARTDDHSIDIGEKLSLLLSQRILLFACRSNAQRFRQRLEGQDVQAVLHRHRGVLQEAFGQYATGEHNQIDLAGFVRFVKDRSLVDSHLTESAVAALFQRVQQDEDTAAAGGAGAEGVDVDMATLMAYPEFVEACAAIAIFKFPNPYVPISVRLNEFVAKLLMTKSLKKRLAATERAAKAAALQAAVNVVTAAHALDDGAGPSPAKDVERAQRYGGTTNEA